MPSAFGTAHAARVRRSGRSPRSSASSRRRKAWRTTLPPSQASGSGGTHAPASEPTIGSAVQRSRRSRASEARGRAARGVGPTPFPVNPNAKWTGGPGGGAPPAAPAEDDSAVARRPEVVQERASVGDALAAGPADLLQDAGHGLGQDDVGGGDGEPRAERGDRARRRADGQHRGAGAHLPGGGLRDDRAPARVDPQPAHA